MHVFFGIPTALNTATHDVVSLTATVIYDGSHRLHTRHTARILWITNHFHRGYT